MTEPQDMLSAALEYQRDGLSVIPLESDGKKPLVKWRPYAEESASEDQIREWWTAWPTANIGIVTGPESGVLIVDVDVDRGADPRPIWQEAPTGWIVETGSGGWHLYYRYPPDAIIGNQVGEDGIDLRAIGGYGVAPPSVHPNGARYRWVRKDKLGTDLPSLCWKDSDPRRPSETTKTSVPTPRQADNVADHWAVSVLEGVDEGTRNSQAARLVGLFAQRGLPIQVARVLLAQWNDRNRPPLPSREVEAVLESIFARQRRQDVEDRVCRELSEGLERGTPIRQLLATARRQLDGNGNGESGSSDPLLVAPSLADLKAGGVSNEGPESVAAFVAFRGRVTLLAAREKAGKSTFARGVASAVSTGGEFLGEPTLRGGVLWVCAEEHEDDVLSGFEGFAPSDTTVYLLRTRAGVEQALEMNLEEHQPVLVVIDTLPALANLLNVTDASSSTQWTKVLAWIVELARRHDVAILLLHHAKKSDNKYRDSTAIGAGVDLIVEMAGKAGSNSRSFACSGRWRVEDFSATLIEPTDDEPAAYMLDDDASLEVQITRYVREHPGCSKRDVASAIKRRIAVTNSTVDHLIAVGNLIDRGGASGCKLEAQDEEGEVIELRLSE